MSTKIKSKDLTYTSDLPPFLQRLHDQKAGRGDQDLHERQIARPKRLKDTDEDDGPTVVDESGDVVSKEEMEKLNAVADEGGPGGDVGGAVTGEVKDGDPQASGALPALDSERKDEGKITTGMGARKRKAGKVVGEEEGKGELDSEPAIEKPTTKPMKKKAKAVKLAFDDGDEG